MRCKSRTATIARPSNNSESLQHRHALHMSPERALLLCNSSYSTCRKLGCRARLQVFLLHQAHMHDVVSWAKSESSMGRAIQLMDHTPTFREPQSQSHLSVTGTQSQIHCRDDGPMGGIGLAPAPPVYVRRQHTIQ
eukprot:2366452-Amphidinium_carterae.1